MNSKNSRTYEYHVLLLKLVDKLDLRGDQKSVALSNVSIYYTWRNIKSSYKNNKFKISAPTWSNEFELPDGSYSISDIQDYFQYILKKHSKSVDDQPVEIFVSKNENRITFKIKNGYYRENKVWFTDQNNNPLEIEDNINITTMIIKYYG